MQPVISEKELPAYHRIRYCLGIMHGFLVLSGLLDICVGGFIAYDQQYQTEDGGFYGDNRISIIWLIGCPLVFTGCFGLLSICKQSKKWILSWVISAVMFNFSVFVYISLAHEMDSIDANLNIYSECQDKNNTLCLCKLPSQRALGVMYTTCASIRLRTTLFLVLVSVFSLALATLIIALFLALVLVLWLPTCTNKKEEDLRLCSTYSSYYAAETTCLNEGAETMTTTTSKQALLSSGSDAIQDLQPLAVET